MRLAAIRRRAPSFVGLAGLHGALAMAGACAPGDAPVAQVAVRDSAGIEIVENGGGGWGAEEAWRVSERPLAEAGSLEGPPGTDLFNVRDAVRLSDGRIVVADGGSGELGFFGADGRFLLAAGGKGDGHGEFRMLSALGRTAGDTLLAFDGRGRISVFTPAGAFVRSAPVGSQERSLVPLLSPVGWLDSGVFVARKTNVDEGIRPPSDAGGTLHYRPRATLFFFGAGGVLADSVGGLPGNESVTFMGVPGAGRVTIRTVPVPFLKRLETAAAAGVVAAGTTDAHEVRLYGPGGRLQRIVRGPRGPRPVTSGDVEAWLSAQLAGIEDPAARLRRRQEFEGLPIPERMPAFESLLLDAGGRLWVREYDVPGAEASAARWSVHDERGRRLGEVAMPAAFRPFEIGHDFVLGVWKDDLDVERVRLYRLLKPVP